MYADKRKMPECFFPVPQLYLTIHLANGGPWWRRFWMRVKYVFGHDSKYGAFDEVLISPEDARNMRALLDEFLAAHAANVDDVKRGA